MIAPMETSMSDQNTTNTTNTTNSPRLREALERVRPEMAALDESKLSPINVDIQTATATVRGSLAEIQQMRPRIVAEVPSFDIAHLDNLETYALAVLHANALHLVSTSPPEALVGLAEEGTKIRSTLLSDATALVNRGIINGASIEKLKGTTGYRNLSSDLLSLSTLLRNYWNVISSKSCVTEAEIDQAEVVAVRINEAYGIHEQGPAALATYALQRQQAYTLFVNAYDQVRRVISFLRWDKGDAENIAPSLYSGRTATKKKPSSEAEGKPETVPTPAVTTAPLTNTTPTSRGTTETPGVGLPGANPFSN
jgi:hypothetical protein